MTEPPPTRTHEQLQHDYEVRKSQHAHYMEVMDTRANPLRTEAMKSTDMGLQWALILLKTVFALDGGGLLYLATIAADPSKYQMLHVAVISAATWYFLWSGGCAAICCGVAYLNFSMFADARFRNANELALRALHPLEPAGGHDTAANRLGRIAKRIDVGVVITAWIALALAVAAYVLFTLGALALIPEALSHLPK